MLLSAPPVSSVFVFSKPPAQKVMEAMGVLAIVVNCYLIGQCGQLGRLFPWLSPEGAIISVVVLEVRKGILPKPFLGLPTLTPGLCCATQESGKKGWPLRLGQFL